MAVASNNTTFNDFEGAATTTDYGGGQGSAANNDVVIQGVQSWGRRVDNTTAKGFAGTATAVDMSAAGVHVKVWLFVAQWPEVTAVNVRVSSGADDDHVLPSAEYPPLGGFVPIWVDVSRAPETGGTANEASIGEIGVLLDIGDVGGNSPNMVLDEILYTGSGNSTGLVWTGTAGDMDDFRTFEDTNNEGNIVTLQGVDFCYSRLTIGDSGGTATTFTDSGFTVIFPDQALVSSTFMGVLIYANNASSLITLSDCTFQSSNPAGATNRPDFLVNQNVDDATDFTNVNALGMRLVQLGQRCSWDGGIIDSVDVVISNQVNTNIQNIAFRTRSATNVACLSTQPTYGSTNGVHDCSFTQADAGHALELTQTGTITFTNLTFSGYGGTPGTNGTANSGASDAAVFNDSGGAVTINISGGDSPSVRNGVGATTTVNNTVTWTIEVRDSTGTLVTNAAEITVTDDSATPVELFHVETSTTGSEDYGFDGADSGNSVVVLVMTDDYEPFSIDTVLPAGNSTITVQLADDRTYSNP